MLSASGCRCFVHVSIPSSSGNLCHYGQPNSASRNTCLNPFFIRESLSRGIAPPGFGIYTDVSIPSSSGNLCHTVCRSLQGCGGAVSIPSSSGNLCHSSLSPFSQPDAAKSQSLLHQGIFVTGPLRRWWITPSRACLNPFFIRESLSPRHPAPGGGWIISSQSLLHQGIFVTHEPKDCG